MLIGGVFIEDTFAEAFTMRAARVVITAASTGWARTAAISMTGFATSVIGCKCEAGIERELSPDETPDGRHGIAVLMFTRDAESLVTRLIERIGQTVLTCPTTACFDGLPAAAERVPVGRPLRTFGDGFQASKVVAGERYWRIPVMEGEFLIQEQFGIQRAIGGGNFLILAADEAVGLEAAERAVRRMTGMTGIILPFPGGVVRSGSKVGARHYAAMIASTNDVYAPSLRAVTASAIPDGVNVVLEIVIDGLDPTVIRDAMCAGIEAACRPGVIAISAGNYGGRLGPHHFRLREIMESVSARPELPRERLFKRRGKGKRE